MARKAIIRRRLRREVGLTVLLLAVTVMAVGALTRGNVIVQAAFGAVGATGPAGAVAGPPGAPAVEDAPAVAVAESIEAPGAGQEPDTDSSGSAEAKPESTDVPAPSADSVAVDQANAEEPASDATVVPGAEVEASPAGDSGAQPAAIAEPGSKALVLDASQANPIEEVPSATIDHEVPDPGAVDSEQTVDDDLVQDAASDIVNSGHDELMPQDYSDYEQEEIVAYDRELKTAAADILEDAAVSGMTPAQLKLISDALALRLNAWNVKMNSWLSWSNGGPLPVEPGNNPPGGGDGVVIVRPDPNGKVVPSNGTLGTKLNDLVSGPLHRSTLNIEAGNAPSGSSLSSLTGAGSFGKASDVIASLGSRAAAAKARLGEDVVRSGNDPGRTALTKVIRAIPLAFRVAFLMLALLVALLAVVSVRERMRARRVERVSQLDYLTGLANREGFDRMLASEWRRAVRYGRPLGLVFIDLDDFKKFNDTHGHLAGDRLLREVAAAINSRARASDFSSRLGGDEFVILCPETTLEGLETLAQRLEIEAQHLPVKMSIGWAQQAPDDTDPRDLIARADAAMYDAKGSKPPAATVSSL